MYTTEYSSFMLNQNQHDQHFHSQDILNNMGTERQRL